MSIATKKRRMIIWLLGLGLLALAGMHPARVRHAARPAPLRQQSCTLPATVITADELYDCITAANAGSGGTITLGADIDLNTLTTSPLPTIRSTITLEGAGYAIDGGNSLGIFYVDGSGDFTVNLATLQNGFANFGGAIFNDGGVVTITNSTFSSNSASEMAALSSTLVH